MDIFLLASKAEALVEFVENLPSLFELGKLLRQGDVGMWSVVGVLATFIVLIIALQRWHGVVIFRWPWSSKFSERTPEPGSEPSAADGTGAVVGSKEGKPSERSDQEDLVLERAIILGAKRLLLYGLVAFVVYVAVYGWIWIEQSAWPLTARVTPISELQFNAKIRMPMDQWHGDVIEIKNASSKKMHIKRVVVNGEHELKFHIDILNRLVPAGPVTIEPNGSAAWYLRGDPPTRTRLQTLGWLPVPMHRRGSAESSEVEAKVQKEIESRAAAARDKAERAWQQQLDEDNRVAANAFRNTVTSIEIDVDGRTVRLKAQDRPQAELDQAKKKTKSDSDATVRRVPTAENEPEIQTVEQTPKDSEPRSPASAKAIPQPPVIDGPPVK